MCSPIIPYHTWIDDNSSFLHQNICFWPINNLQCSFVLPNTIIYSFSIVINQSTTTGFETRRTVIPYTFPTLARIARRDGGEVMNPFQLEAGVYHGTWKGLKRHHKLLKFRQGLLYYLNEPKRKEKHGPMHFLFSSRV